MTDLSEIPVVRIESAKRDAYESGYAEFEGADTDDEPVDLSPFYSTARYANHVLPSLRAASGHADAGHGTYTRSRPVAVMTPEIADDAPAVANVVDSSRVMEEIQEAWANGARAALNGEEPHYGQ